MKTKIKKNIYNATPAITQYLRIKNHYHKILLMYRMGDFYEFLFEDAHTASALLNIQLTSKGKYNNKRIPMAGIPCHSLRTYLKRIITAGISVAICEQIKTKKTKKSKLLERKVIRVITPGTLYEDSLLDESKDNLIISIIQKNNKWGISWLEFTTGAFGVLEVDNIHDLRLELDRLNPVELLISRLHKNLPKLPVHKSIIKPISDINFDYNNACKVLFKKLNIKNINKKLNAGVSAAGAIIQYINNNKIYNLAHINHLIFENKKDKLKIDRITKKHLELDVNVNGKQENTLFSVLNNTMTHMGSRLLKKWINNPITNYDLVFSRQKGVEIVLTNNFIDILQKYIKKIGDIERIVTRISLKTAKPLDLIKFKIALNVFPKLKTLLKGLLIVNKNSKSILNYIHKEIFTFPNIALLLDEALVDNPPNSFRYGYVIKSHFNKNLDKLRKIYTNSEKFIKTFENKEKLRTGIIKLKVTYNKLHGLFIEIPKGRKHKYKIPKNYIRTKTLKNSERFYTSELKYFEKRLIESKEKSIKYEKSIFKKLIKVLVGNIPYFIKTSKSLATLDVITTFAERALTLNYCKPIINKNKIGIKIMEGRHPVIESTTNHHFVPNNLFLNHNKSIHIITGPNMGGKSTFIRQIAIIVLLTYIGSYVPAKYAEIGPIDQIFTRIGGYDDLSAGKSTFMIEMHETAKILNTATFKSLVLMDEIGRGTNPTEGLCLAWACLERIIQIKALTLFSTHYFSLTQIAKKFKQITNLHFSASIKSNKVSYIYNIQKGATNNSYSSSVASLANIAQGVINKSNNLIKHFQDHQKSLNKRHTLMKYIKSFKYKDLTRYLKFIKSFFKNLKDMF